jgi:hypothetical protein
VSIRLLETGARKWPRFHVAVVSRTKFASYRCNLVLSVASDQRDTPLSKFAADSPATKDRGCVGSPVGVTMVSG